MMKINTNTYNDTRLEVELIFSVHLNNNIEMLPKFINFKLFI